MGLLVALLVIVCSLLLVGYIIAGITAGMGLHKLYFLHRNSLNTLRHIVKPGMTVKGCDFDYYWSKTDFGDYNTRWVFVDPMTRKKCRVDIAFNIKGHIVSIERYELNSIKDFIRDDVDLSKYMN